MRRALDDVVPGDVSSRYKVRLGTRRKSAPEERGGPRASLTLNPADFLDLLDRSGRFGILGKDLRDRGRRGALCAHDLDNACGRLVVVGPEAQLLTGSLGADQKFHLRSLGERPRCRTGGNTGVRGGKDPGEAAFLYIGRGQRLRLRCGGGGRPN
jgi:hypothetical protein